MGEAFLTVLSWFLPAKPAVSVVQWGPFGYRLPAYLRDKFEWGETLPFWNEATVAIENISGRSLKSVRVKLNRKTVATPEIVDRHNKSRADWTFDEKKGEVELKNVDPGAHLFIHVFCDLDDEEGKIAPEILVDDALHTRAQNAVADWRSFFGTRMGMFLGATLIAMVGVATWVVVSVTAPCTFGDSDACYIKKATERIKGGCHFSVAKVTTSTEQELEMSRFPLEKVLFVNRARSMGELLARDKIVVCSSEKN